MAFFTTTGQENTEESLRTRILELEDLLARGELTQAEYDKKITQLEARSAMLSTLPLRDAETESRIQDLEYLHEKRWITDQEYKRQKKELTG